MLQCTAPRNAVPGTAPRPRSPGIAPRPRSPSPSRGPPTGRVAGPRLCPADRSCSLSRAVLRAPARNRCVPPGWARHSPNSRVPRGARPVQPGPARPRSLLTPGSWRCPATAELRGAPSIARPQLRAPLKEPRADWLPAGCLRQWAPAALRGGAAGSAGRWSPAQPGARSAGDGSDESRTPPASAGDGSDGVLHGSGPGAPGLGPAPACLGGWGLAARPRVRSNCRAIIPSLEQLRGAGGRRQKIGVGRVQADRCLWRGRAARGGGGCSLAISFHLIALHCIAF